MKIKSEDLANKLKEIPYFAGSGDGFLFNYIALVDYRNFRKNELICKEGEYAETCFIILSGSVGVFVKNKDGVKEHEAILRAGETFGEVSTISGNPRIATIKSLERTEVVQMDKKALFALMESSKEAKNFINQHYRERFLKTRLKKIKILEDFPNVFFEELLRKTDFVTYSMGETVISYGEETKDFYLIIDGFAKALVPPLEERISPNYDDPQHQLQSGQKKEDAGLKVVAYLPPGHHFGNIGLIEKKKRTATIIAFTRLELVKIDQIQFHSILSKYCDINDGLKKIIAHNKQQKEIGPSIDVTSERLMDWIISSNVIRTNAALVIDLNKCVKCETCIQTCEKLFGTSRLSFGGLEFNNFLIPAACWHCHEPLCLEGCPTGAIVRDISGDVYHKDFCIGCGNCAKNCSFGNITIVNRKGKRYKPRFNLAKKLFIRANAKINQRGIPIEVLDRREKISNKAFDGSDRRKDVSTKNIDNQKKNRKLSLKIATKCDKCKDFSYMGCVQNCPSGAAQRVNPHEHFMKIIYHPQLLQEFIDKEINPTGDTLMTQKSGLPFFHKVKLYTLLGVSIFSLSIIAYTTRFASNSILILGTESNKILGWVLAGIFFFLVLYSLKKRKLIMYFGKLNFWYSFHFYIGLIGIIILIIHSKFSLGFGLSKTIAFLLLFGFLNGFYGVFMHFFIPEIFLRQNIELNNIIEIKKKRDQFSEKLNQLIKNKSEQFRNIYSVYIKRRLNKKEGVVGFLYSRFFNKDKFYNPLTFLVEKENEVPEDERRDYHKLLVYYGKWYEIDKHLYLIGLMNYWLNYHVSVTTILSIAVTLHIFAFYYY